MKTSVAVFNRNGWQPSTGTGGRFHPEWVAGLVRNTQLVPDIVRWTETASLSIGNWTSMAEIKNEYSKLNIKKPLIYKNKLPFGEVNRKFKEAAELYVVGFDKLQIPRFIIKYKYSKR